MHGLDSSVWRQRVYPFLHLGGMGCMNGSWLDGCNVNAGRFLEG